MKLGEWVGETTRIYFENATAKRDYRVQLRGNRSVLLFALYLGMLIGVAMFVYSQTAGSQYLNVVDAQRRLSDFYEAVMVILGATISVIAPALTATTVVLERQRQSLDLVFSAPVKPKYYLVGKMVASYRYTWMLLVLSLPVTATCVVLGGAAWSDVLIAYLLLSMHALVLTAMGLLMSTLAPKPVSAIVWSYGGTIAYLIVTSILGGPAAFASTGREVMFTVGLNPFYVVQAADTYSVILSQEVPNWLLASLVCLLLSKLIVLTAGAQLAPSSSKEVVSLRIHAMTYLFAFAGIASYLLGPYAVTLVSSATPVSTSGSATTPAVSSTDGSTLLGILLCILSGVLFLFLPMMTCFGLDSLRRFWPNGMFRMRHAFDGTPAGGLPFLLMLLTGLFASVLLGTYVGASFLPQWPFFAYALFMFGFWVFFWSVGRLTSSFFLGLRAARTLQFAVFVAIVVLPVPFLSAVAASSGYSEGLPAIWDLWILRPLLTSTSDRAIHALISGVVLLLLATVIAKTAENRVERRLAARSKNHERSFATT